MEQLKFKHKDVTGLKVSAHQRLLVLKDSGLSFPVKNMYLYICEVSSWGAGLFTKDRLTIQKELGMPKSTVQKYLKILVEEEYILRVSCYHEFAFNNINHFSFIFPLRYHEELFYKEDIDKIKKNVLNECDKIEESCKVGLQTIRDRVIKG